MTTTYLGVFARLGYHDGAAQLVGVGTRGRREALTNHFPEVKALPAMMGPAAFDAAFDAGTALDPKSGGNLARQLIARVRADQAGA